jgi:hypothetical protein
MYYNIIIIIIIIIAPVPSPLSPLVPSRAVV